METKLEAIRIDCRGNPALLKAVYSALVKLGYGTLSSGAIDSIKTGECWLMGYPKKGIKFRRYVDCKPGWDTHHPTKEVRLNAVTEHLTNYNIGDIML